MCFNKADYEIIFVDKLDNDNVSNEIYFCAKKENELEIISIKSKETSKEQFILDLFDKKRNLLPINYKTVLYDNIVIKKYEILNDEIHFYLKDFGLNNNLDEFTTALMWSYRYLGYNKIKVFYNNKIYVKEKNCSINTRFREGLKNKQIIYFIEENSIKPITFFHDYNKIDFIVHTFTKNINYSVHFNENTIYIDFDDLDYTIDNIMINNIVYNLENSCDYKKIILTRDKTIIYEKTNIN